MSRSGAHDWAVDRAAGCSGCEQGLEGLGAVRRDLDKRTVLCKSRDAA